MNIQVPCACFGARPENSMVFVCANAAETPSTGHSFYLPTTYLPTSNQEHVNCYCEPTSFNSVMTWHRGLDIAIRLYNAEAYEDCIAHIRSVLRHNTPNYACVRYYILLACCIDDWHEAEVSGTKHMKHSLSFADP
jgi:hypothetical protein